MTSGKTLTQISDAFDRCGFPLMESRNFGDSSFSISIGQTLITVRYNGSCWLTLDLLLEESENTVHIRQDWELLCLNAEIYGPARFYNRKPGSYGIRADIAIPKEEVESIVIPRLQSTLRSITAAYDLSQRSKGNSVAPVPRVSASPERIQKLCEGSGWHFIDHSPFCTVGLNVPERIFHASFDVCTEGGFIVSVMLEDVTDWTTLSRNGLSHMLLSFIRSIRMVRPSSFVNAEGSQVVLFELFLGQEFSLRELDLGLSSLSVACQLVGDELAVLKSARVAEEYLAVTGWNRVNGKNHLKKGAQDHEYINT